MLRCLAKKALQTSANVAKDVLAGENFNTAVTKRGKQAIGGLLPQEGVGRKAIKRKTQHHSSTRNKKLTKNNATARTTRILRAFGQRGLWERDWEYHG